MRPTVLFDIFGTLLETDSTLSPFHTLTAHLPDAEARVALRRSLRREVTLKTLPTMADAARLLERRLAEAGGPEWQVPEADVALAADEMKQHLATYRFIDGAADLLRDLRAAGWQIATVSNIATLYFALLDRLGLPDMVDAAAYSCEAAIRKPDPRLFWLALSRLPDVPPRPADIPMIGDQPARDVAGAEAAGLRGMLVHGTSGRSLADVRAGLLG